MSSETLRSKYAQKSQKKLTLKEVYALKKQSDTNSKTLRESYKRKKLLTEEMRIAEETARLILEEIDKDELAKTSQVLSKLNAIAGAAKNVPEIASAIKSAAAEVNEFTGGGMKALAKRGLSAIQRKFGAKAGANPILKSISLLNSLEQGLAAVPAIIKNNIPDFDQSEGSVTDQAGDDKKKLQNIEKAIVKGFKPGGMFARIKSLFGKSGGMPYIANASGIAKGIMSMTGSEIEALAAAASGGPSASDIGGTVKDMTAAPKGDKEAGGKTVPITNQKDLATVIAAQSAGGDEEKAAKAAEEAAKNPKKFTDKFISAIAAKSKQPTDVVVKVVGALVQGGKMKTTVQESASRMLMSRTANLTLRDAQRGLSLYLESGGSSRRWIEMLVEDKKSSAAETAARKLWAAMQMNINQLPDKNVPVKQWNIERAINSAVEDNQELLKDLNSDAVSAVLEKAKELVEKLVEENNGSSEAASSLLGRIDNAFAAVSEKAEGDNKEKKEDEKEKDKEKGGLDFSEFPIESFVDYIKGKFESNKDKEDYDTGDDNLINAVRDFLLTTQNFRDFADDNEVSVEEVVDTYVEMHRDEFLAAAKEGLGLDPDSNTEELKDEDAIDDSVFSEIMNEIGKEISKQKPEDLKDEDKVLSVAEEAIDASASFDQYVKDSKLEKTEAKSKFIEMYRADILELAKKAEAGELGEESPLDKEDPKKILAIFKDQKIDLSKAEGRKTAIDVLKNQYNVDMKVASKYIEEKIIPLVGDKKTSPLDKVAEKISSAGSIDDVLAILSKMDPDTPLGSGPDGKDITASSQIGILQQISKKPKDAKEKVNSLTDAGGLKKKVTDILSGKKTSKGKQNPLVDQLSKQLKDVSPEAIAAILAAIPPFLMGEAARRKNALLLAARRQMSML